MHHSRRIDHDHSFRLLAVDTQVSVQVDIKEQELTTAKDNCKEKMVA